MLANSYSFLVAFFLYVKNEIKSKTLWQTSLKKFENSKIAKSVFTYLRSTSTRKTLVNSFSRSLTRSLYHSFSELFMSQTFLKIDWFSKQFDRSCLVFFLSKLTMLQLCTLSSFRALLIFLCSFFFAVNYSAFLIRVLTSAIMRFSTRSTLTAAAFPAVVTTSLHSSGRYEEDWVWRPARTSLKLSSRARASPTWLGTTLFALDAILRATTPTMPSYFVAKCLTQASRCRCRFSATSLCAVLLSHHPMLSKSTASRMTQRCSRLAQSSSSI